MEDLVSLSYLQIGRRIAYRYSRQFENVTNNQMELLALIHALELTQTKFKEEECFIYSDSAYCVNSFNLWIRNWAKNNWLNSKNQVVENLDLMKRLYKFLLIDFPNFEVNKCPGHAGIVENEIADALASNNQTKFAKILKEYNIEDIFEIYI